MRIRTARTIVISVVLLLALVLPIGLSAPSIGFGQATDVAVDGQPPASLPSTGGGSAYPGTGFDPNIAIAMSLATAMVALGAGTYVIVRRRNN